jgi:glycosyltransferase involved in cell wall biosynthesis
LKKLGGHTVLVQISDFGLGRGLYLADALCKNGLQVNIITNKPVFGSGGSSLQSVTFTSKPRIITLKIPFAKALYRSIFGRLIFYLMFMLLSFLELITERPKPQLLYSRGPQPFTEISCLGYKLFYRNTTIVSDTTDLWPDAINYLSIGNIYKKTLIGIGNAINNLVYSHIDSIVTLNDELSAVLENRFKTKPHIIYGVIDLETFKPQDKNEALSKFSDKIHQKLAGKFIILYAGLLGPFQNPLLLCDVAKKVVDYPNVLLLVLGEGPLKESLQSEVKKYNLSNILFLETQPFEKMPLIYSLADICILSYAQIDFLSSGLPKKFIEYSASGKPILCITPPCVASKLCTDWGAGLRINPQEIDNGIELIKKMQQERKLKEEMSLNSRKMAEALFSIEAAAEEINKILLE